MFFLSLLLLLTLLRQADDMTAWCDDTGTAIKELGRFYGRPCWTKVDGELCRGNYITIKP